jgi:hypothetical protein
LGGHIASNKTVTEKQSLRHNWVLLKHHDLSSCCVAG